MKVSSPIPHKRARIEIIPLIDIMFFLLASFMMVSLSQTHMKGIRVNLPSPIAAVTPPDPTVVNVQVLAGNTTYINREYVADDQVLPRLFEINRSNPGVKVSISAEEQSLHGDVITLLDRVRTPASPGFATIDASSRGFARRQRRWVAPIEDLSR